MVLFGSLNTAYTGLAASQVAVDVTGNNIANANTDGYTRQRAVLNSSPSAVGNPGMIGTGVYVSQITRITDTYAYNRYRDSSASLEYANYQESVLKEASSYFPDLDSTGLQKNLSDYFAAWQSFSSNPSSASDKTVLAQSTLTLSTRLQETRAQVSDLQKSIDNQLQSMVDEVNQIGQKIADINKQIYTIESNGVDNANGLRDQRDSLELSLGKLLGVTVSKRDIVTNTALGSTDVNTEDYVALVGGRNIIDGATFHPLVMDKTASASGFSAVYYQSQDYTLYDVSNEISGGKIGAILDLRGKNIGSDGIPTDGKLQKYIDYLDTLAAGIIENSNNIYASSAHQSMVSNQTSAVVTDNISLSGLPVSKGSFDLVAYDKSGKEVARRTINVDPNTDTYQSVINKITAQGDDNKDNIGTNDVDDYFNNTTTGVSGIGMSSGYFQIGVIEPYKSQGVTFSIVDNGTNFSGALGLGRFFDGNNASNITLNKELADNNEKINAFEAPVNGNNSVANKMLQLQYDKVQMRNRNGDTSSSTIGEYYRWTVNVVATETSTATQNVSTATALNTSVQETYNSITKVSTDEELTNLIRYQSGYSANAKVISTLDKMLDTLLGIKS